MLIKISKIDNCIGANRGVSKSTKNNKWRKKNQQVEVKKNALMSIFKSKKIEK
jgi:hypothetical protein